MLLGPPVGNQQCICEKKTASSQRKGVTNVPKPPPRPARSTAAQARHLISSVSRTQHLDIAAKFCHLNSTEPDDKTGKKLLKKPACSSKSVLN